MHAKPPVETRYVGADGVVTPLFRNTLQGVLYNHVEAAKFWAPKRDKPLADYTLREAHIVGSTLRGIANSDLDILLIASKMDGEDYRFLKQVMAQLYFAHRPKQDAIDVFIRPSDEYPERESFEITSQVKDLLDICNSQLEPRK